MLVKMFVVLVLVPSSCGSKCLVRIDILDCSGLGLKDLEPIYNDHYNLLAVKFLFLDHDNITRVNFSKLVHQLPHIKMVNLKKNPFNCEATLLVEVKSNCPVTLSIFGAASVFSTASVFPTTSLHRSSLIPVPSTTVPSTTVPSTTVPSTTIPTTPHRMNRHLTAVLASVLPSLAFLITLIVRILRIKIRKYRRRRYSNLESERFASWSSDTEESLYETPL